jgi:hypothetical protein
LLLKEGESYSLGVKEGHMGLTERTEILDDLLRNAIKGKYEVQ